MKLKKLLLILSVAMLSVGAFTACGNDDKDTSRNTNIETSDRDNDKDDDKESPAQKRADKLEERKAEKAAKKAEENELPEGYSEEEAELVQADIDLCKEVRSAIENANMSAQIENEPEFTSPKEGDRGYLTDIDFGGEVFIDSLKSSLGVEDLSEVDSNIQSTLGKKEGKLSYVWVSESSVVVYIDNTDKNAGTLSGYTITSSPCNCIYSGPVELYKE